MILSVVSLKGGTGKSTLAVNLACALGLEPRTVHLIDADAQGTATAYADAGDLPITTDPMPLEREQDAPRWIERVLDVYADVVIDCPPHLRAATEAAVGLADLVLIPCGASGVDLLATVEAVELVNRARASRPDGGPRCLLVPSRIDRRTAVGREIEAALRRLGEPVGPAIGQRTAFVDAFAAGVSVNEYAPRSKASAEIDALAGAVKRSIRKG